MCSIPTGAQRAGMWFSTNIAENDNTSELSSSPSSTTSTGPLSSSMSFGRWLPRTTKEITVACKPATKKSGRAISIPVGTDAAKPRQSNAPNHGVYFLAPESEALRSLNAIAANPNTWTSHDESEGARAAKYREQHREIKRIIANSERLDRQIREAIAEAMCTPITDLKPGDIEKDDWLLVDKATNELLIYTEDGWDLVDDEVPRMSSWRV